MTQCGDVFENKVTGEYAVVLRGTTDRGAGPAIVHLTLRPGAAVVGEHVHPQMWERFTVLKGTLSAVVGGSRRALGVGESLLVEAGVAHDWWNESKTEDVQVLLALDRAEGSSMDPARFEMLIATLFGLANDGKVDKKGRPTPLQAAVIAQHFSDVIVFTRPPRWVQATVLSPLAHLGRRLGYKPTYPKYLAPHARVTPKATVLRAANLVD